MAAGCADEPRLNVGQPGIIRPAVTAERNRMAARIVCAVDQQAAHALLAHVGEGDFLLGRCGHASIKALYCEVRKWPHR
jgi:hypothetical protein